MSKKNIQKKNVKHKSKFQGNNFLSIITGFPVGHFLLAGVVLTLYFQLFSFELGKLDEDLIIQKHTNYLKNFENITDSFSRDAFYGIKTAEFYRPVQNMSFFFDYDLSGEKGWGYYLMNIIIHVLTCLALFKLLGLFKIDNRQSFFLTILFAVSPLFVQAIAWAPGRGDLLIGLFGSLSLVALILFLQKQNIVYLILHFIIYGLAVFSKETAVVLAVLYLIVWFFERKRNPKANVLIYSSPIYLLIVGIYFVLRNPVVIFDNKLETFGINSFFGNLQTIPEILIKFIVPVNLSPFPAYSLLTTVTGILFLAIVVYLIVKYQLYKNSVSIIGISLFLLTVVPGMFYTHQYKSFAYSYLEHRSYLPIIGVVILFGSILNSVIKSRNNTVNFILLAIAAVLFSYNFVYQNHYKDPKGYYLFAIEQNPKSAIAYNNLGRILLDSNKNEEAAGYLRSALSIMPKYPEALNNLGMYYGKANRLDTALVLINQSIELNPNYASAYNNRGIAKCLTGHFNEAIIDFNHSLAITPDFVDALNNRGNARHSLHDKNGACSDWQTAAELGNKEALKMLNIYCK